YLDVMLIVSEHPGKAALSWSEKFAFVVSSEFVHPLGRPLPFLAYPDSVSHKRAMEILETSGISFKTVLTSRDLATHFSLCEGGRGVMVFPERFIPKSLKVADWLPAIPPLQAGVYVREGFEPPYLEKAIECIESAFKPVDPGDR